MTKKHIYFVRHGQSEYNISEIMLVHDTPLTILGKAQAQECAERCATLDHKLIVLPAHLKNRIKYE